MTNTATENPDTAQVTKKPVPIINLLPGVLFKSPFRFLKDAVNEHGDFIRIKVGPWSFYLLSNPDHFQYVLRDQQKNFKKSNFVYEPGSVITGNGLITSDGDFWLRQRRIMQPYFHRKKIETFAEVMTDAIDFALDNWLDPNQNSGSMKLMESLSQITVEVTTKVMFGANTLSTEEMGIMSRDQSFLMEQLALHTYLLFLPEWVPRPRAKRFKQVVKNMRDKVQEIIELGRADKDADTLLAMLLRAVDEETNEGMTDDQLFDEIQTIFVAGFETTSRALTWMFYLLDKNPEIQEKIIQEIDQVLGDCTPTFEDIKNLPYCKMVVQEALRYYPPVVALPRTAIEDDNINGQSIPSGKMVVLFYYGLHHNTKVWQDPERFDPERFTSENTESRPHFAYLPFGAGPRQCIGNEFAMMESILALVMILQRYRIKFVDNTKVIPQIAITLSPKHEIDVIVTQAH